MFIIHILLLLSCFLPNLILAETSTEKPSVINETTRLTLGIIKNNTNISDITLNNTSKSVVTQFASEGGFVNDVNENKTKTTTPIAEIVKLFSPSNNTANEMNNKTNSLVEILEKITPGSLRHDSILNNSSSTVHARKEVKFEKDELSGSKPRKGVESPPEKSGNSQNNISVIWNSTMILKPKPLVTTDTDEVEIQIKNINYTMNSDSNLSGSRMVLPIVIPILALPLVAGILFIIYKRSSEFWEHRHYRRMDFLIDGMYNE